MSLHCRAEQVRGLIRILAEAGELRPEARPQHFLDGLVKLIGAEIGVMLTDPDFWPGHRGAFRDVVLSGFDSVSRPVFEVLTAHGAPFSPAVAGFMNSAPSRPPGHVMSSIREQLASNRAWYESPYYNDHVRPSRLDDGLYAGKMLARGVTRGVGFLRASRSRLFDDSDASLLTLACQEIERFVSVPQPAARPRLSPREAQALAALLDGASEKQVAERLGVSYNTAHQYVKGIYRHYRVHSRGELMARLITGCR